MTNGDHAHGGHVFYLVMRGEVVKTRECARTDGFHWRFVGRVAVSSPERRQPVFTKLFLILQIAKTVV